MYLKNSKIIVIKIGSSLLVDENKDGYAETKIVVADNLDYPTGVSIHNGDLYFSEIDTIWVIKNIDDWLKLGSDKLPKKYVYMSKHQFL